MKRRALLGTLASLAVAGCTSSGSTPDDTQTTQRTTQTTDRTTQTTDATTTATLPDELRTLGAPASDVDCPVADTDDGRVVVHGEHPDSPLSLSLDDDTLDLPADETTFVLANDTDYRFMTNFYGWKLSKRVDGRWFRVAPQFWPQPLHSLPAGESHEWSFAVDNGDPVDPGSGGMDDIALAGLGGGTYAFTTHGSFSPEDGESVPVGFCAEFELNGDPVELTPTDGVTASRDGATVTVTTGEEPTEDEPMSAFVVERVEPQAETPVRERITEQLLRPDPGFGDQSGYRNTIPFFEDGVDTVRLEAPNGTHPPFGVDEGYFVEYEGERYRISSERPA
ncbi:immunoglobulin-like domain-containing protein [Halobacterium litoreum]|uniref:Immunoglobulin-like domain-containing protein n=1 Tax=Halobacterium litoreum TaxID=2039234 RepID=A0ABD5NDP6_9EURY|nr:immunoglobulin-like domain-containing protein [Halobacterium litoreum]UHH14142.1 hypothetical protein LT972_03870 [Halobacterium litoreum]